MKRILKIFAIVFALFTIFGCEMGSLGGTKTPDLSKCQLLDKTFEYDGEAKSLEVINLPKGATVEYVNNEQTEVGEYVVQATVSAEGATSVTLTANLIIKRPDPFKNCVFETIVVDYDGEEHSVYVENVPENVSVEYIGNGKVNAGYYDVVANLVADTGETKTMEARIIIKKIDGVIEHEENPVIALIDMEELKFNATINNDEQTIQFREKDAIKGPGKYRVTVYANSTTNYNFVSKDVEVEFITNYLDVKFDDEEFVYDGKVKKLDLVGESLEGYNVEFVGNAQTEVGRHKVKAIITDPNDEDFYCSVYGILVIDYPKNAEFEQFMDELLVALFEGDQMSINFFFVNPEDYGLEHYEATLPVATFGDYEAGVEQLENILNILHEFDYATLSSEQKMSYTIVEDYFDFLLGITEEMDYMTNSYLGSYLGYQSNLPLNLAEYKFRNEQDIIDFISYMENAEEAFESYYQFTLKQREYGYGLSDTAIDNVISQCEKFVEVKENHYLIDIFNSKISEITFELSSEAIENYKVRCSEAVKNDLCNAYQYIADNLGTLKEIEITEGGLYHYGEDGVDYYELMLQNTLGYSDLTVEEAIAYMDGKLKDANKKVNDIVTKFRSLPAMQQQEFLNAVNYGRPVFSDLTPAELVELFKKLASDFVPDLAVMPEISIKNVYESLQENFSPAAYFVSPLDETKFESIYLNGKYTDDVNYIFTTLAHEGYPGHLYQNVYAKQLDISNVRKIIRCEGYMEGWATYMEMKSYAWVTNYTSSGLTLALEYLMMNDVLNGYLSSRVDLGIHAEGWFAEDIANYMNDVFGGGYETEDMQEFYDQVVEIPTNMSMYFYSYAKLQDMHEKAVKELGYFFDEVEFNTVILDCGAAPLEYVEDAVDLFIQEKLYEYGK